MAKEVPKW